MKTIVEKTGYKILELDLINDRRTINFEVGLSNFSPSLALQVLEDLNSILNKSSKQIALISSGWSDVNFQLEITDYAKFISAAKLIEHPNLAELIHPPRTWDACRS